MNIMRQLFCAICFICMMTSCSKVYEVEFDNLLLSRISKIFNTPDYISGCRMEIKTSDNFNIDEYSESLRTDTRRWFDDYGDYGYSYMRWWDENSGVFDVPSGKGQISIYSYEKKVLELKYEDWTITSCVVWQDDAVVCEYKGKLGASYENEQAQYYFLHGELIWYNNDSELYMQKKVVTEGYSSNCKQYDEIKYDYYPTGIVSRKVIVRHFKDDSNSEGSGYSEMIVEDVYYNRDGSKKTIVDRLFENHEEYVILNTGYSNRRHGNFYIVLMPRGKELTKGYGAIISSNKYNISSFVIDRTFEYRIDNNEIICDEFYYHERYRSGRISNQKRRTLEIDVDYQNNIVVKGEFVINGWEADCDDMQPIQNGYSNWLYRTLKNDYISER